jgi:hypothetical protein
MDAKPRLKISILSGVFCLLEVSILGGIAVIVLRAVRSPGHLAGLVRFIPVALVFAAIQAVPFGLIIASIGGWWLAPRVARPRLSRRCQP